MGELLLRWGICCAGRVSNEFTLALNMLPKTHHQIVAIATRNEKRSKDFAALHSVPKAYGSYKELAADPEIDVVYIGAVQTQHLSVCKMMLEAEKHVLCEKPLGVTASEVKEMSKLAKSKEKFLMEGFWTRFFPAYAKMREVLRSGAIGQITHIQAQLGIDHRPLNQNAKSKEPGGGALLSLGGYPIQLAQLIYGEKPIQQNSFGVLNENGVDTDSYIFLRYSGDRTALLSTSIVKDMQSEGIIYGTNGSMKVSDLFYAPTKLEVNCKNTEPDTYNFPIPSPKPKYKDFLITNAEGFAYEAEEVRQCIMQGKTESSLLTLEMSLEISEILQKARQQVGYDLPQDKVTF